MLKRRFKSGQLSLMVLVGLAILLVGFLVIYVNRSVHQVDELEPDLAFDPDIFVSYLEDCAAGIINDNIRDGYDALPGVIDDRLESCVLAGRFNFKVKPITSVATDMLIAKDAEPRSLDFIIKYKVELDSLAKDPQKKTFNDFFVRYPLSNEYILPLSEDHTLKTDMLLESPDGHLKLKLPEGTRIEGLEGNKMSISLFDHRNVYHGNVLKRIIYGIDPLNAKFSGAALLLDYDSRDYESIPIVPGFDFKNVITATPVLNIPYYDTDLFPTDEDVRDMTPQEISIADLTDVEILGESSGYGFAAIGKYLTTLHEDDSHVRSLIRSGGLYSIAANGLIVLQGGVTYFPYEDRIIMGVKR